MIDIRDSLINIGTEATIAISEYWSQTTMLRWSEQKVLQQMWRSNIGNEKWEDVPTETE